MVVIKKTYIYAIIERFFTGRCFECALLLGSLLSAILMFYRVYFGTEFTDEAYTVSDVLAAINGNIPYTDDTVIAAGQVFIPSIVFKLYMIFVPNMEGLFLYSRITYTVFRFITIIIIYITLSRVLDRKWRLLVSSFLIVYVGSIPNWGYNGTSMVLSVLNSFLLYMYMHDDQADKFHYWGLVVCGAISALTVFTHPVYAVMVIVDIFIIIVVSKNKTYETLTYCVGGIAIVLLIITPIIIKSGIKRFLYGVESCFITAPDNFIKTTVRDRVFSVFSLGYKWWALTVFIAVVLFMLSLKYIRINEQKLATKEYWLMSVSVAILLCLVFAAYRGFDVPKTTGILCVCAFILLIPTYEDCSHLACFFGIYNILFIIILTITSLTGDRFYYCIPMMLPILIDLFKTKHRLFHEIAAIMAILLIVLLGRYSFKNIYRDDTFRNLTARVEEGVFKGIYTTPDRANDVVELEKYINENISLDETVSFRDNAPVAYLMRNKNICDVRTWDIMQYSYDCNDPTLMYRYYKNKQQIPDVIAYIDFGRDEMLSIEDSPENFQFNNFVNKYYYLDKDDFKNNTFRVLIYRNNGTFNNDYDGLIESIKK
jgi:hypothetical protein